MIDCNSSGILEIVLFIKKILNILQVVAPILLIVIAMVDVVKLVSSPVNGSDKVKKAIMSRFFAAIMFFLVPSILNIMFNFFADMNYEQSSCWVNANEEYIAKRKEEENLVNTSKDKYENFEEMVQKSLEQRKALDSLKNSSSGNSGDTSLENVEELIGDLPDDLSESRRKMITVAASAIGKIPYYYGGTASNPGFEGNNFGSTVGPDSKGRTKKGLDCSHFIDWVGWTAIGNNFGNGNTRTLYGLSTQISKSELIPGDIAFLMSGGVTTHVGLYIGNGYWIHESSSKGNVALSTMEWDNYRRLSI